MRCFPGYRQAWSGQGGYAFGGDELYGFVSAVGQFHICEVVSLFYQGLVLELAEAVFEGRSGGVEALEVAGGVEDYGDVVS